MSKRKSKMKKFWRKALTILGILFLLGATVGMAML